MNKIQEYIKKLSFYLSGNENYLLYQNQLFSKQVIAVKHDRIQLIRRWITFPFKLNTKELKGEQFYLLLIHTDNIAHFFHDVFFPFYVEWRKNKKRVCVSIKGDHFQREFLESIIGPQDLIFLDYEATYSFSDLIITPEGRDLKIYPEYLDICQEIKNTCFAKHSIVEARNKNLIYGRNELSRKNLLNIDQQFLKANNIEQVFLSKLGFRDYLDALAKAETLTYMVGAGVFNLLFLDSSVRVLEINPYRNNSWAQMFGMSNLCQFNVVISNNLANSSAATQDEAILDSHVYFDVQIEAAITSLVTSNN
jgi:hypothetical protein